MQSKYAYGNIRKLPAGLVIGTLVFVDSFDRLHQLQRP
jgi:hypothetical protein